MSSDAATLLEIADQLYALPQEEFTPARDARAKELKADKELAAAVKKLKKPSVAAWVVNLFVRRESDQVEQLIGVGRALRDAQEGMDGAELRALTKQRRQLTSAVTQQARALAQDEGVKVTQSVADQVEATLTAAMLDPECAKAVRSGLLTAALASTGVDEVDVAAAVAVPEALGFAATATTGEAPAPPDLHVVPNDADDEAARKRDEAESALAAAQKTVDETQAALAEATTVVEELQARSLQLQSEMDELKRKLTELEASAEETDEELEEAEESQGEAEAAHSAAMRTRDMAKKALDRLARG
jgi:DNA repair exonuclease SbcCD ATPase subunit